MSPRFAIPSLLLALVGCGADVQVEEPPPPLVAGAPLAGAAESTLKLPVGTPLAGFTSRCQCLGGTSKQDDRDSNYNYAFIESTGVHLRPTIKVVWISNGDKHLVMTKTDTIYSFDGLVEEVTRRLEEATGEELDGMVTHSGNHTHSSYGTFSKHQGFFLGHDKFNRENFERMVDQIVAVALEAHANRKAASLGFAIEKNWDPTDSIYSDRRGDNNGLIVWDDMEDPDEQWKKDPYMHLLRIDDAVTADPIAMVFGWGMHPIVSGEGKSVVTGDATVAVEIEVQESFDKPMVAMFLQTGGGDASVRGRQDGWARMETVGALAVDKILAVWEDTPTSSEPILLETMSRSVPMNGEAIHVTRDGEVDWSYPAYKEEGADNYRPDDQIYAEDGSLLGDFDEWYTGYGAVFCGSGNFALPVGGLTSLAPEYETCMQVSFMKTLIEIFFYASEVTLPLPLDGMTQTYTAASRMGPIAVRDADGTKGTDDVLLSFFPGEPLHFYTEMWRRRAKSEHGYEHTALFGYSMDHEGYLVIAEDWLSGGYEPDITFWGPLAGEWIMENVLEMVGEVHKTDLAEPFDATRGPWTYADWPMPDLAPDPTPDAGTRLTTETIPTCDEDLTGTWKMWIPREFEMDLDTPAYLRRIEGSVQIAWKGGDPGVDNPRVTLEKQGAGGAWEPVKTHSGRILTEDYQDFGLAHTPCPYFPATVEQDHYWWAVWQAVGHVHDRAGLPEGTYRLKVEGKRYAGQNTTYPWDTEPYTVEGTPFVVQPALVTLERDDARGGFWASLEGPEDGFRMVDLDGDSVGHNPLRGALEVTWTYAGGDTETFTVEAGAPEGGRTFLAWPEGSSVSDVYVRDVYGNHGVWD